MNPIRAAAMPSGISRLDLARFQQSRTYDLLMRLPLLAWFTFLALVSLVSFEQYLSEADPDLPIPVYAINIAMRLSVMAFLVIVMATVIVRMRPTGKARGFEPRISALLGTFLFTAVVLFPRRELSLSVAIVSTLVMLAGNAFAIFALIRLRGSFSIMAEARQLVTTGIYRHVRHPLYLAEAIAAIGAVMQFLSVWTMLLLAVQTAFQLRRMRNEERLLSEAFPEYAVYKEKTARLIPGLY
jgi:protein-S-isoprenylcysteine O-methyltransferase Ste14